MTETSGIKRRVRATRVPSNETKASILEAAQAVFSANGYAKSLVSDIAEAAEVSSALVIQHFQTKSRLFEASLSEALALVPPRSLIAAAPGKSVLTLLQRGDVQTTRAFSMLAHAIADPELCTAAARLLDEMLVRHFSDILPGTDLRRRAKATTMMAIGYAVIRLLSRCNKAVSHGEKRFDEGLTIVRELTGNFSIKPASQRQSLRRSRRVQGT